MPAQRTQSKKSSAKKTTIMPAQRTQSKKSSAKKTTIMPAQRAQSKKSSAKKTTNQTKPVNFNGTKLEWRLPRLSPNGDKVSYEDPNVYEKLISPNTDVSNPETLCYSSPPPLSHTSSNTSSDMSKKEQFDAFRLTHPKFSGAKAAMNLNSGRKQATNSGLNPEVANSTAASSSESSSPENLSWTCNPGHPQTDAMIDATEQQLLANNPRFQQPDIMRTSSVYYQQQLSNLGEQFQTQDYILADTAPVHHQQQMPSFGEQFQTQDYILADTAPVHYQQQLSNFGEQFQPQEYAFQDTAPVHYQQQLSNSGEQFQPREYAYEDITPVYDPRLTTTTGASHPYAFPDPSPVNDQHDEEADATSEFSLFHSLTPLAKYIGYPTSARQLRQRGVRPLNELLTEVNPPIEFANADVRDLETMHSNSQQVPNQSSLVQSGMPL